MARVVAIVVVVVVPVDVDIDVGIIVGDLDGINVDDAGVVPVGYV